MTRMLFDENPLVIDPKLAKTIGLNESIIIQQMHYWLMLNKKAQRNYHDGKYWTYNTYDEWVDQFPFWSKNTIRRAIGRLEEKKILLVGHYNKLKLDNTKWYSIDYDVLETLVYQSAQNGQTTCSEWADDMPKMGSAIPETTTETNNIELSIINNIVITDDLLQEIEQNSKSLDKENLYALTQRERKHLENDLSNSPKTLLEIVPSSPAAVILYTALTKKEKFKKLFPFDVNRQSLAKIIITYIKEFDRMPDTAVMHKMTSFLSRKEQPNVINRAIRNAKHKGDIFDNLEPYIAEIKEIDRNYKKKYIGENYEEQKKKKQEENNLRNISKNKFGSF